MDQKPEACTLTYDSLDNPKTDSLLQADDPMQLLKGISDMFVNYEPSLGFDNQLEFGQVKRSNSIYRFHHVAGWDLVSHSILNKFAPRHAIFLQELLKKKRDQEEAEAGLKGKL